MDRVGTASPVGAMVLVAGRGDTAGLPGLSTEFLLVPMGAGRQVTAAAAAGPWSAS